MKLLFNGYVTVDGKIHFNRKRFEKEIRMFASKEITLTVEKKKKKRSNNQNAYYHGVVIPLIRQGLIDVGYKVSLYQTHGFLKSNFNTSEIINEQTGEVLTRDNKPMIKTLSTTTLTTSQFMDFIASIQQWAAEYLNIIIPDPHEQLSIEFNNPPNLVRSDEL